MGLARFRGKADRIIDSAHNAIANAEMLVMHSFTDAARTEALAELNEAQSFLRRACEARDAWDAVEHGDYDEYPDIK